MDRIKELELQIKGLEAEVLRQKGMVSQLEIMDDLQSQYEPLNTDGFEGADEETIKEIEDDSKSYGEAQDKLRELRGEEREQIVVLNLNEYQSKNTTTKVIGIKDFHNQDMLEELNLETGGELFDMITEIDGKSLVTFSLNHDEFEETPLIVGNGSYLEGIDFNDMEDITISVLKGEE